jgi:hypothetical protein
MDRRVRMGCDGVGDEFVVVEGELGGQRREGEMVEVGGGAVLATSSVGVLIVCDIHDDDGYYFGYRMEIL